MRIIDEIIEINGRWWKIREASSMSAALDGIAFARVSGSIGSKTVTHENGTEVVTSDVVQINSDGTERQPYTLAY